MQVFVGKAAPDFTAKAIMPDNSIESEFNLRRYAKGHKVVLLFYPLDFTFVCPSEIIALNNRLGEFTERGTRLAVISVDSHFSHLAWKNTASSKGGIGNIQLPMISDINKVASQSYNVLHDEGMSLRGTFIIDEEFIVRHLHVNDLPIGRNIDEVLRIIDALDFFEKYGEVCPAGWQRGDEGINPSHKGIAHYLASNAEKL